MASKGLVAGKPRAAQRRSWICFEDEAGQTLRPPKARSWSRRGQTPHVRVPATGSGRISLAGLLCLKPDRQSRLSDRTRTHRARAGKRHSVGEADYAKLLDAAHQQLGGPIVLIRNTRNTHISRRRRALTAARDWLHVIQLPAYTPKLTPVEGVWSPLKRGLGNLAATSIDHRAALVKNRLKRLQYHSTTDEFFAQTRRTLDPEPQPPRPFKLCSVPHVGVHPVYARAVR